MAAGGACPANVLRLGVRMHRPPPAASGTVASSRRPPQTRIVYARAPPRPNLTGVALACRPSPPMGGNGRNGMEWKWNGMEWNGQME